MSLLEPRSTQQYDQWIAAPPQADQSLPTSSREASRAARHELLREHLAPLKQSVHGAVTKLHDHLVAINTALEEFLDTRQKYFGLLSSFSSLFEQLQLPANLSPKTSESLLKEYMNLAGKAQGSEVTIADVVVCLNTLKQDCQELLQGERTTFVQVFEFSKQRVLALINTTDPLATLESLIDTNATPAGTLLTTLREKLYTLAATINSIQPDTDLPNHLAAALEETQNTLAAIVTASSPYAPPYGKISSDHFALAGLRDSIRNVYPTLPKLVLEESTQPVCSLPTLTCDEKRAYLVVARHLDATTATETTQVDAVSQGTRSEYQQLIDDFISQSATSGPEEAGALATSSPSQPTQQKFRETAQRERDELLDDMIRGLGISEARTLVISQAETLSSQHPELKASLDSALKEAHARFEDRLLQIQCDADIAQDIAQYLARQQIRAVDLQRASQLLKDNPELEICCANIVTQHQSIPSSSAEELVEYLKALADILCAAKDLSPLVFESLLYSPSKELTSVNGVRDKAQELFTLAASPEKLKKLELALLTSLTGSLLQKSLPASDHNVAQYAVAAQIVVHGLAPELHGENVERPVRTGKDITKLVNRATRGKLSVEIVCQTLRNQLIPHIVVCKKQSKRNQGQHEFQIATNPTAILTPVVAHLTAIATRTSASTTKTPTPQSIGSQSAPITHPHQDAQTTTEGTQIPVSDTDLRAHESQTLLNQRTRLEQLARFFDDILSSLTKQGEATPPEVKRAAELTPILTRVPALATRLSSSLQIKMQKGVFSAYRHDFDKLCFSRLSEKAGYSQLTSSLAPKRSRRKTFDSAKIPGLIFDCLLEKYPETKPFLQSGTSLVATFRRLQTEIESAKAILPEDSATRTLSAIKRHLTEPLKLTPEGTATLSVFCSWISNSEFQTDITQAVAALSKGIRDTILRLTDSPTPPVQTIDTSPSEDRLSEDTV